MKKPSHSQRAPRPGNSPRRNNGQGRPNRSPSNGPNRQHSRRGHSQAVQAWMEATPQTLTSHIPMSARKNRNESSSKKPERPNGFSPNGQRNRWKSKNPADRSRQDANGRPANSRNKQGFKPRREEVKSAPPTAPAGTQEKSAGGLVADIGRFELFSAYHLGIGPNKEYKPSNINEVAKRFKVNPAIVRQALKDYGMDSGALLERDFDMALAQLDIQVAPEGIDRNELAKNLYEEFLEAPVLKRDWKKILEEDRKENMKIFGNK